MIVDVTVVTPSVPGRGVLLAEACASVAGQTAAPRAHLVGIDHARAGPARTRNALLAAASTEWVAFLDDDDVLDPDHLESLLAAAEAEKADLVYSYFRVEGRPWENPNRGFDEADLRVGNYIPVTVLARRRAVLDAGGFAIGEPLEDWVLWIWMLNGGAKFACLPRETWTYRWRPREAMDNRTYRVEVGER